MGAQLIDSVFYFARAPPRARAPALRPAHRVRVRIATVLWVGESAGGRLLSTALSTGAVPKLRYLLGIVVVVLGVVLKRVIYTGVVRKTAPYRV